MERGLHTMEHELAQQPGSTTERETGRSIPPPRNVESRENALERESAFEEVIIHKLVERYFTEMEEAGVSAKVLDGLAAKISLKSDNDRLSRMLAVPYELRRKLFQRFAEENTPPDGILEKLRSMERLQRDTVGAPLLGFHTAKSRKLPEPHRDAVSGNKIMRWDIKGREHSDFSDVPQAYAARKYHDLYRERDVRYLYVVRDNQSNPLDSTTGWSHAPRFSIIAEFPLNQIDEEVATVAQKAEQKAA